MNGLHVAEEERNVQQQRLSLLRFLSPGLLSDAVLHAGLNAADEMSRSHRGETERLRQHEEVLSLRAALLSANEELEELRRYKASAQRQLELVAQRTATSSVQRRRAPPVQATHAQAQQPATASSVEPIDIVSNIKEPREEPRAVVEAIRRVRLNGSENAGLRGILSRALQALSTDLYAGAGHLLPELVQSRSV
jgi:hypothetical protein